MSGAGRNKVKIIFVLLAALLVLAVAELAAWAYLWIERDDFTFYDPMGYAVDEEALPKLRRDYDRELGWKQPSDTPFGERPREREYERTLLATFGDSYTYGDEVEDDETWQTYLSRAVGQNAFNFGANGYGTDQAYLRFQQDWPRVRAPLATLGLTADNIKRVVNVYRKFFYRKTGIPMTKPRFVLERGELKLLENPIHSADELEKLLDPAFLARIGRNDLWYNRNDYPVLGFPHLAVPFNRSFRLELKHGKLGNRISDIDPRPWDDLWSDAESRQLMFAIFDAFFRDARELGATPILMILPKKKEVAHLLDGGEHRESIRLILEHAEVRGYEVFNAIDALAAEVHSEGDLDSFYTNHVTARGNEVIASHLRRHLESRGYLE